MNGSLVLSREACADAETEDDLPCVLDVDVPPPEACAFASTPIPTPLLEPATTCRPGQCTTTNSTGWASTDLAVLLTAVALPSCVSAVAAAAVCRRDQHDRPVAGAINVCPDALQPHAARDADLEALVLHELVHVLAFAPSLFPFFRSCPANATVSGGAPSGDACPPRTLRRASDGLPLGYPAIANTTLQPAGSSGKEGEEGHAPLLLTPAVTAAARRHYACADDTALRGAPLQNVGGSVLAHWAAASLPDALLAPGWQLRRGSRRALSPLTVALLQDTGWYSITLAATAVTAAHTAALPLPAGAGGGCAVGRGAACVSDPRLACPAEGVAGCHALGLEPAVCRTVAGAPGGCRHWVPQPERDCSGVLLPPGAELPQRLSAERTASTARCFVAGGGALALCLRRRCASGHLQLQGAGVGWATCGTDSGDDNDDDDDNDSVAVAIAGLRPAVTCPAAERAECKAATDGEWAGAQDDGQRLRITLISTSGVLLWGGQQQATAPANATLDAAADALEAAVLAHLTAVLQLCPGQLLSEGLGLRETTVARLDAWLLLSSNASRACPTWAEAEARTRELAPTGTLSLVAAGIPLTAQVQAVHASSRRSSSSIVAIVFGCLVPVALLIVVLLVLHVRREMHGRASASVGDCNALLDMPTWLVSNGSSGSGLGPVNGSISSVGSVTGTAFGDSNGAGAGTGMPAETGWEHEDDAAMRLRFFAGARGVAGGGAFPRVRSAWLAEDAAGETGLRAARGVQLSCTDV